MLFTESSPLNTQRDEKLAQKQIERGEQEARFSEVRILGLCLCMRSHHHSSNPVVLVRSQLSYMQGCRHNCVHTRNTTVMCSSNGWPKTAWDRRLDLTPRVPRIALCARTSLAHALHTHTHTHTPAHMNTRTHTTHLHLQLNREANSTCGRRLSSPLASRTHPVRSNFSCMQHTHTHTHSTRAHTCV